MTGTAKKIPRGVDRQRPGVLPGCLFPAAATAMTLLALGLRLLMRRPI